MKMPANSGGDFTPPPEGTHLAVCYRVIDLGTQQVEWQGTTKHQHKILLSWELPDERMDDGRPFTISQRYTLSSSEKSKLRQDLEAWRGKKFADDEIASFDIKNLIGVGCYLSVVHSHKNGSTYANVQSIVKLPKGTKANPPENTAIYFSLDHFEAGVFEMLSEGIRNVIVKSPEYGEAIRGNQHERIGEAPDHDDDMSDAIPF